MRWFGAAVGNVLLFVRWWFGVTYLVGVFGVIAGPVMMATGDAGGFYFLIGGPFVFAFGWVIHPWGGKRPVRPLDRLQRTARREAVAWASTLSLEGTAASALFSLQASRR
jgi:hypothetical protein